MFRRTKLSLVIAGVTSTLAAGQVVAQENTVEEVVVTGIRGSLMRAMDVKRDSSGVVDAISAEDMGKFPDTNLAESLQRITGVSIDRVNGEGSQVTVRGFGGGYNMVTLNGRQMPSANVANVTGNSDEAGALGTSRSFDFSNLASEGVQGIQVYKTANAKVVSGGMGATINVQTNRPLEAGDQASVGVKLVNDQSGSKDITPEVSGLFSMANEDNTFGISVFGSYQERSSGAAGVNVSGYQYLDYDPTLGPWANAERVNEPAAGSLVAIPWNIGMNIMDLNRERSNAMVTMQFAPSDRTTITADVLYTQTTQEQTGVVPGIWFNRNYSYVEFDGNPIVATPLALVELHRLPTNDLGEPNEGKDYFYANRYDASKDTMQSVGINIRHEFSDRLTVSFDAASSEAESGGNGPNGWAGTRINIASSGAGWQGAYYGDGVPTASVGVLESEGYVDATGSHGAWGNGNGVYDRGDINTQTFITNSSMQKSSIDQFNLDGTYEVDDSLTVDFGAGFMSTEMAQVNSGTLDYLGGWGVGNGDIPDDNQITEICGTCAFGDLQFNGYPNAAGVAPDGYVMTILGQQAFTVDAYSFIQYMDAQNDIYPNFSLNNLTDNGGNDNLISEDITSVYVNGKWETEFSGKPVQVNFGVRYEETDVNSATVQVSPTAIIWESNNDFAQSYTGASPAVLDEDYSYSNILPNLDVSVDLTDEMKLRASYGKSIARPGYSDMFVKTGINSTGGTLTYLGGYPTASKGTAKLDPLESDNFDLSLEYYYDEASYVSAGYFYKKVENFVGTAVVPQPLFGLRDAGAATAGSLSGQALAKLQELGLNVNEDNMFTMSALIQNFGDGNANWEGIASVDAMTAGQFSAINTTQVEADYDITPGAGDPLYTFNTSQPVNNQAATIDGWEFAVQHFFGDTGFGVSANATMVDGDIGYDVSAHPSISQFALLGLSDSANLVLMYEDDALSARVAYNWRDTFLNSTAYAGQAGSPVFVKEFSQIDLNITYNVTDDIVVSLDGINVTGEGQKIYGRTEAMQYWNGEADPRYMLSARYSF